MKLLGITIEGKLRFDEHISNLCNKAAMQLNAINCLQRNVNLQETKAIINRFQLYSLVWRFSSCKSFCKTAQIKKTLLKVNTR